MLSFRHMAWGGIQSLFSCLQLKMDEIKLYIHPVLLLYEPIRPSCNLMSLICQKMDHKKPNLPSILVYSLSSTRSIATGDIATLQKMWENNSWARLKASRSVLSLMFLDFQSSLEHSLVIWNSPATSQQHRQKSLRASSQLLLNLPSYQAEMQQRL